MLVQQKKVGLRASNSKRNNYSQKKLAYHINYLNKKIASYLTELDETNQLESVDRKPSGCPTDG